MKDEEFVARVRQHRPRALLPHIAELAANRQEPEAWIRQTGMGAPWALAEIARVSIAYGGDHRKDAGPADVVECNHAYNELEDPFELVEDSEDSLAEFFLRVTEQLDYQLPLRPQITRSIALLAHTAPTRPLKVLRPGWDQELFGTDLLSYNAVGQFLYATTLRNGGRFNPQWLAQPSYTWLDKFINPGRLRAGLKNYVADADVLKATNGHPPKTSQRRFAYNPLRGHPAVSGLHEDWLIPVPRLIIRQLSPLGIYYAGMRKWGPSFAEDLGDLFENYIGMTLRLQTHGSVQPEFEYDHDKKKTVDYIVIFPEVVVLVEVKSARPTAPVREGSEDAGREIERMLGKGMEQLERADELIEQGHPAFAHIPTDRPRVGVLVTMESFHVLNSPFYASMFKRKRPAFPITIASAGDIEFWVTVDDTTPGQVVLDALARRSDGTDPALGVDLKRALEGQKHRRNPLLEAAWQAGPWQQLKTKDAEQKIPLR